jgi:hypothetical protein
MAEGQSYTLTLINNANQPWTFYVYQRAPDTKSRDIFSLAWLVSPIEISVGGKANFNWTIDYMFVWDETEQLRPGITFSASGTMPCSLSGKNSTKFSTDPTPQFSPPFEDEPVGTFVIKDSTNVPPNKFSVGICMHGAGTFVERAGPNVTHLFASTPSYWVAGGHEKKVGDILDIEDVTHAAEAHFPPDVFHVTGTLNKKNEWNFAAEK